MEDPTISHYDSDYPSPATCRDQRNFDGVASLQQTITDIGFYRRVAGRFPGKVLDLCCGTGRVAIPLAEDARHVTAVDISGGMLARFHRHLLSCAPEVRGRIELIEASATDFVREEAFSLVMIPFNSITLLGSFDRQLAALRNVHRNLRPGGCFVLDTVNPYSFMHEGSSVPTPFYTRYDVETGIRYTRFYLADPMDEEQRQRVYGWYDNVRDDGSAFREPFEFTWRVIHRFELQLMLESSGFVIERLEGDFESSDYSLRSPRIVVTARKR